VPAGSRRPTRLTVVLAQWCPHCVPLSVRKGRQLAKRLGIPLRTLDIDRRGQEKSADRLVRAWGDPAPDYLIPQVFLEWSDGTVEHLLTGFSERVARTERAWDDLLASAWVRSIPSGVRR
jgi:glutaredoxin